MILAPLTLVGMLLSGCTWSAVGLALLSCSPNPRNLQTSEASILSPLSPLCNFPNSVTQAMMSTAPFQSLKSSLTSPFFPWSHEGKHWMSFAAPWCLYPTAGQQGRVTQKADGSLIESWSPSLNLVLPRNLTVSVTTPSSSHFGISLSPLTAFTKEKGNQENGRPFSSVQFGRSVMSDSLHPKDCNMPGFPVHHQHSELTQTRVHQVSDTIQLSHPLSSPSPPALNLSQHQNLFQWVSPLHQVAKVLELQFQHQSSNEYSGLISFRMGWLDP